MNPLNQLGSPASAACASFWSVKMKRECTGNSAEYYPLSSSSYWNFRCVSSGLSWLGPKTVYSPKIDYIYIHTMFLQTRATDSLGPIGVRLINAYQPKYDGFGLRKKVCLSFTILGSIWKLTCLSRLTHLLSLQDLTMKFWGYKKNRSKALTFSKWENCRS